MAKPKFVLKEPTAKEPTLIYMFFRFDGNVLKYSTRIKVNPKFWNEETQEVRQMKGVDYELLNGRLINLSSIVSKEHIRLVNEGIIPSPEKLRIPLDNYLNKTNKGATPSLLIFIDEFIKASQKKPNTKKQYKTALTKLKEYKTESKKAIEYDSIDLDFYNDFVSFLFSKKYSTNSIGTVIKNIKVFMNEAIERGYTKNDAFKNKRFKITEEASETIYLSEADIEKIYKLDLKNNKRLDKVRDLFIIGCYTGLRFSDLVQLRDENLIDNKTKVKIKTEKTGEVVVIPLHSYIKEILKKNGGIIPDLISNQKMNEYLKELGKKAEINEDVLISSTKGGKKHSESFKKYDLITVHTARRSFATNAYLNDIPSISIMKITGHKTENAFLKYIKISQEDNANKLINHPFFN